MRTPVLLNVLDIYLDDENPRHEPINDQQAIFSYLINDELVKPLAKDISQEGLSPLDLPAVMENHYGQYIALEGNRRLCATKLLLDPEKAPDSSKKYFKKLAEEAKEIPKKVRCIIFDNREDADTWIDRKHNGLQGGIGTKDWDAEQKVRRNKRNNKADQNALAQALLDYSRKEGYLDEIQKRVLTTAARYLGNPYFRRSVGIVSSRSETEVVINVSHHDFEEFLKVFCKDLVAGQRVNSRSSKNDWEGYARLLMSEGAVTSKVLSDRFLKDKEKYSYFEEDSNNDESVSNSNTENTNTNTNSTDTNSNSDNTDEDSIPSNDDNPNTENSNSSNGTRSTQNPDIRKYIIPQDFRPSIQHKNLRRVFQELKTIEIDDKTLAVSLVTRAFLEKIYNLFYEAVEGNHLTGMQTHQVISKVISLIEKDNELVKKEKEALGALRAVASNKNNVLSPQTLGANAHASYYPDAIQLRREFDNISAIIEYMIKRI